MKFKILNVINGAGPVQGNISKYPGAWPKIVIKYLIKNGYMYGQILEPFGGGSNLKTLKLDINPQLQPDIIADSQKLPFKSKIFDCAILDPPYSKIFSKKLYKTNMPDIKICLKETSKCIKDGGYISVLCFQNLAAIKNLHPLEKVFVNLGPDRNIRCLNIFRVNGGIHENLDIFCMDPLKEDVSPCN